MNHAQIAHTRKTIQEAIDQGKRVTIQYLDTLVLLEPHSVDETRVVGWAEGMNRERPFKLEFISEVVIVPGVVAYGESNDHSTVDEGFDDEH